MNDRIVEGVIGSTIAGLLIAVLAKACGFVEFQLEVVVMILALAVIFSLWIGLRVRRRLLSLQRELDTIPYEQYFPDEPSVYPSLPTLFESALRLRLISLANTNVFYMFDHYKLFLSQKKPIEVLCLDPEASAIVDGLDKLVAIAAANRVLPKLQKVLEGLPITEDAKEEARMLLRAGTAESAAKTMIQLSLIIWRALSNEAEKKEADASRFLTVRLYRCPPTIKGWIIGDNRVLRGDFSIPGYGLTEPLMLFDDERATTEIKNFRHTFHLLWTDKDTRTFLGGGEIQTDPLHLTSVGIFSSLAGSFYEKSGKTAIREAMRHIHVSNGTTVVDIGAGTGHLSFELARKIGASGCVMAIDRNEELVATLGQQLRGLGWPTKGAAPIKTVAADAHKLKLPKNSIDFIWCRHSIHHFIDPGEVLGHIWDWLKMGGSLILIEIAGPDDEELLRYLNKVAFLANPEHVRYYSFDQILSLLEPFKFELGKPFFSHDYEIPISDYARRCVQKADYKRLGQLTKELSMASDGAKEFFHIRGGDSSDIVWTLPEVVLLCTKGKDSPNETVATK